MSILSLKITKPINSNKVDNTWLDKGLQETSSPQETIIALKLSFIDGQCMLLQDTGKRIIREENFPVGDFQLQLTVDEVSLNTDNKEEPYFEVNLKNYSITDFDLNSLNDLINSKPPISNISQTNPAGFSDPLSDPLAFLENGLPVTETLQSNVISVTNYDKERPKNILKHID